MDEQPARLRWGTGQRLEFIEFCLFWGGAVNRSDIVEKFAVSAPQASADLAQYRELAPSNLRYDSSAKRFLPTENFKPKFLIPNAERYLAQLRAVSEEVISADDTWFSSLPDIGVVPTPSRRVEPDLLRQFLAIMRARQGVTVEYQSMNDSRPAPMWRGITPHALATDGLRWHLRAYCHIDRKFKDFIISRCLKIGDVGPPLVKAEDDREWSTFFNVILIPNPKLSRHQQTTIERDYGMSDGKCVLKVRLALLYYLDKRLRLDIAETHDRVKEAPVVVANRSEYEQRLKLVAY